MEPKVIVPSVGRRVHYHPSAYDLGLRKDLVNQPETYIQSDLSQPCDAGIVYVHNDRLVNLVVVDHNGHVHRRCSVQLVQPGEELPDGLACATWPPCVPPK